MCEKLLGWIFTCLLPVVVLDPTRLKLSKAKIKTAQLKIYLPDVNSLLFICGNDPWCGVCTPAAELKTKA